MPKKSNELLAYESDPVQNAVHSDEETYTRSKKKEFSSANSALLVEKSVSEWSDDDSGDESSGNFDEMPNRKTEIHISIENSIDSYGEPKENPLSYQSNVAKKNNALSSLKSPEDEAQRSRSSSLGSKKLSSPQLNPRLARKNSAINSPESPKGNSNRIEIPINELTIKEKLGEGAFGAVYQAELWGSEVAVKQFINISNSNMNEFYHEVSVLKSLRHVNIVLLMGYARQPLSIITEVLNQGSLYSVLHDETNRISHSQIMKAALGSAQGIKYLHSRDIFHKDIKSQNVLIGDNFEKVKVCDFGLSLVVNDETGAASKYVGSAQWRAPEATSSFYNKKCDVYSFGVLLWECLTRKKPFDGVSVPETLNQIRGGVRPPIPFYCPPAFKNLIERCWNADPQKRPEFDEIIKELSSDLFVGEKGKNEEEEAISSEMSAVREAQSLHFILPELQNVNQSTPRYARIYSSMFRPNGTEEGVNFINDFLFDGESKTWEGEKSWEGGMLFTGDYGNYLAVLVFDSMQNLKGGDNEMIKNVKHFERMAELSCKSYMSELLEMVALEVKPGATSALMFRYQVVKGQDQELLEAIKREVIPLMKQVENWRGAIVFMNHETSRVMVTILFEGNDSMREFQKMTPKMMTPLKNLLEGVPTIEKLKLEHGFLANLTIKPLKV
eukprot:TRINITY_DN3298_c0_g1_i1.p1 TRINITY_DN3298_c0_g1~~TRINITY_DN3298_c0_g1_i1.p1  ORF type:complete len:669 (-),score=232.29 TRINITY_DN3298_c0_g1_i1:94-2100(-)